jgi:hypothetical protein
MGSIAQTDPKKIDKKKIPPPKKKIPGAPEKKTTKKYILTEKRDG